MTLLKKIRFQLPTLNQPNLSICLCKRMLFGKIFLERFETGNVYAAIRLTWVKREKCVCVCVCEREREMGQSGAWSSEIPW